MLTMRQSIRTRSAGLSLLCGLVVAALMSACGGSVTPTPLLPVVATITTLPSIDEMLSEKIQGSPSAPVVIIEYVSYWSTTSKDFYLTGEGANMKAQLADTGRAQIFFRNIFQNNELQTAVGVPVAPMLARCAGNANFFPATTAIYQAQPTWLAASDPNAGIESVMLGFGMSQSVISACLSSAALVNGLGQIHTNALQASYLLPDGTTRAAASGASSILALPAVVVVVNGNNILLDGMNNDGTPNAAFTPTLAHVQQILNASAQQMRRR